MHNPIERIAHTTAVDAPVMEHWLERQIAQWVHPMKDRSDDPSHHERTLLPWSYISLPYILKVSFVSSFMHIGKITVRSLSLSVESPKTLLFLCVCNGSLKLLLLGFHLFFFYFFFGIRITTSGL